MLGNLETYLNESFQRILYVFLKLLLKIGRNKAELIKILVSRFFQLYKVSIRIVSRVPVYNWEQKTQTLLPILCLTSSFRGKGGVVWKVWSGWFEV